MLCSFCDDEGHYFAVYAKFFDGRHCRNGCRRWRIRSGYWEEKKISESRASIKTNMSHGVLGNPKVAYDICHVTES